MALTHTVLHETLENSISLVMVPVSNTEAVTTMVLMGVGSRYESDAQQGLAHFTEHLVFKGGKRYTNTQAIAQALDGVGGEFNAFTAQEYTGFYAKTAAPHVGLALDVISDIVLNAKFPADELEKEKGVIVEEINMYEDMPMRKVDNVLSALLFGDTPLGRPIIGTKQSVTAFTVADFEAYRAQFYMGTQCTVAIAGSFDPAEVRRLVSEYFATLPKGAPYKPAPAVLQQGQRVLLETKKSEQTHLMLAVEAYPMDHPRRHALKLLSTILGGTMSSRLFEKVREEQGLCYYVRSAVDAYVDAGFLVASAGVDNSRLQNATVAILKEMRELRDGGATAAELDRAKQYLIGRTLLAMEDSENVAEYYASQDRLENKRETPAEVIAELEAVTLEEVSAVAQEIFHDSRLRLAIIGPHADEAALDHSLTLDK